MNKVFPVTIQKGSPHSFELIFILMSNQVVNTSSVQAQFAALATDKEKLRSMIASADQQRRDEEQQLDLMRKEQQTLHEAIGTAHSQVGRMKKKRQHYMQDKEKWTLKLEEEQVEMKRITELIHDKEAQEQEMKIQFCKQMESYHDELLLLMQKCYEKKFIQLMSGSTMMTACQDLIFEFLSSSSNTCTVSTNNNSCNKNMNIVHDGNDNKVMEDFLSSSRDLDTADPNTSTTTTTMIHDENTLEHDTYTFDAKKNIQILCNQLVMEEEKYMTLKRMEEQLNDSYVSLRINALEYCSNPMNGKVCLSHECRYCYYYG